LNNVFKFDIHGTSYIFEISNSTYDSNLDSILESERNRGLYDITTYEKFSDNARKISTDLKKKIDEFVSDGYKVVGYGAAAKGMTLLNFADIKLDYIIDDNELKHNLFTPGKNIPIKSISLLNDFDSTDKIVFLPLAWNFFDEIYGRIKSVRNNPLDLFIKYFPEIKVHSEKLKTV